MNHAGQIYTLNLFDTAGQVSSSFYSIENIEIIHIGLLQFKGRLGHSKKDGLPGDERDPIVF